MATREQVASFLAGGQPGDGIAVVSARSGYCEGSFVRYREGRLVLEANGETHLFALGEIERVLITHPIEDAKHPVLRPLE